MRRFNYSIIWFLALLGFTTLVYAAKIEELDMADQMLQSVRENQTPKYAPQEYREAEDIIRKSHKRANEFSGEADARILAIWGIHKANYAKTIALEKQQEEKQALLKIQIEAARKNLKDAKILLDKVRQELEFYKLKVSK